MKKLEKLSKEQEDLMPVIRDRWVNTFHNNTTFNEKSVVNGIEWLYDFCKLKKPQVFIMDNPFYVQVLANMVSNKTNVRDNVWGKVGANVGDNVGDNAGANVRANVMDDVWDNVRDNVWANVRDNIWANVGDNVRDNVRDNVDGVLEYITPSSFVNYSDAGWVAFYDYFTEIGVLKFKDFDRYKELIQNGVYYSIMLDGVCIVSRPPIKVVQNNTNQLHNINGSALDFKGYSIYSIRGVNITEELFNKLSNKGYTFKDFVEEKNEEVKNAALSFIEEKFGSEYLYDFLSSNMKEVDTFTDLKNEEYLQGTTKGMNIGVYTLYKGNVNNVSLAFIRCFCPSTDRMFFLGVDPVNSNAKDAIASLYRVPRKLVADIKYINRQGERFSTVFKNKELLSSLSKEEVEDLVSISGNDYFKLIKYEY